MLFSDLLFYVYWFLLSFVSFLTYYWLIFNYHSIEAVCQLTLITYIWLVTVRSYKNIRHKPLLLFYGFPKLTDSDLVRATIYLYLVFFIKWGFIDIVIVNLMILLIYELYLFIAACKVVNLKYFRF